MQQIKKFGAIGGAIVLVACWPLAVGQIAQNVLRDSIASLNNSELTAEVVDYDRGYFSAVATTKYTVQDPALKAQFIADGMPAEFMLQHNIEHGLTQVTSETHFVDLDAIPALLSTVTQLNGNTDFVLAIDNVDYQIPDASGSSIVIASSEVKGKATVLGEVDLSFDFPAVQLHFGSDESIKVSSITGYAQGKKVNGFWHGEQQINIEDSAMLLPDGTIHSSAHDFSYKFMSSTTENGERLDTNHIVKLGNVVSGEEELNGLNLDFTLGQLNKNAFEGLVGLYQSNPVIDSTVLAESGPLINELFNHGFKLALNELELSAGEGTITSDWSLEVPQGTSNVTEDFSKIIPALTGYLNSYVSNDIIKSYPHMQEGIDELVIMEIMEPVEDGYKIDANILNGNVVFSSGQQIPLAAIFMSMMMQ